MRYINPRFTYDTYLLTYLLRSGVENAMAKVKVKASVP